MINSIIRFLRDHSLVWCVRCRAVYFAKDMHYHATTTGVIAALCENCEKEMYHPWRSE